MGHFLQGLSFLDFLVLNCLVWGQKVKKRRKWLAIQHGMRQFSTNFIENKRKTITEIFLVNKFGKLQSETRLRMGDSMVIHKEKHEREVKRTKTPYIQLRALLFFDQINYFSISTDSNPWNLSCLWNSLDSDIFLASPGVFVIYSLEKWTLNLNGKQGNSAIPDSRSLKKLKIQS